MEAIILAGGMGTRLQSAVPNLPKPLAPVAGRPFLEILLTRLSHQGFQSVVLSVGYLAEMITAQFGERFHGMKLVYALERSPLGTGGAIRLALTFCENEHVFVFNGDTFLDLETAQVEERWQEKRLPIIVAREVSDTFRFNRLEVREARVNRVLEKGISGIGLINAGCYVFPANLLDGFPPGHAFSLETDFLSAAVRQTAFECFVTRGRFIDIGVPEDYARAQRELAGIV